MPNPTMPQPVEMTDDELDEFTDLHDRITDLVGTYRWHLCSFDPRSTRYEVNHFTFYISYSGVSIEIHDGGLVGEPVSFGATPLASLQAFWASITDLGQNQTLTIDGQPTEFRPQGAFVPVNA